MMEEVLELLAADSPREDRSASARASTTTSNATDDNHNSSVSGLDNSSGSGTNHDEDCEDSGVHCSADSGSAEALGEQAGRSQFSVDTSPSNDDSVYSAGHRAVHEQEQGGDSTLELVQQMENSMYTSLMPHAHPTAASRLSGQPTLPPAYHRSSWSPQFAHSGMPEAFGMVPGLIASAATASVPNVPPPPAALPVLSGPVTAPVALPVAQPELTIRGSSSPHKMPRASLPGATSKVLPTPRQVHVMNSAEFDELRRKLRMQIASRRYRKRKKEESRQQKAQIQQLQAELARLEDMETQTKQYQQRSLESLEGELKLRKDEVVDLSEKIQDAAKEELDWITAMSSHSRK
ncbi:hypothetical protein PHYPSEUDO_003599 [Phytophthora pseudosyringae]|uniref:BZIP domain-containing protein n=1 Tax=Phytophthora pseudosyringae TaxID=221518 RepID=A0A8T1VRD7_9STRA|nr:hypothetical protein PHYPSEUDO_003599 [Phytophthora pseudosyringae]